MVSVFLVHDGFTLGDIGSGNNSTGSANNFISWNWKANGSGSSNTAGSITSTVSANVDAGFSIINYVGDDTASATVGHGLSVAPEMVIIKNRSASGDDWWAFGSNHFTRMRLSGTSADEGNYPLGYSSSLITLPNLNNSAWSGEGVTTNNYIMYAFHSVDGYSKVGSYTGNGATDGPFVYTGFRPKYVLWRRSNDSGGWTIWDDARDSDNEIDKYFYANSSDSEFSAQALRVDFLSNGFKPRTTNVWGNASGSTYVYIAFAETPFKYSNAR